MYIRTFLYLVAYNYLSMYIFNTYLSKLSCKYIRLYILVYTYLFIHFCQYICLYFLVYVFVFLSSLSLLLSFTIFLFLIYVSFLNYAIWSLLSFYLTIIFHSVFIGRQVGRYISQTTNLQQLKRK